MKHAPNTPSATSLTARSANGLTAGLDWAKDDHVVCVVDDNGQVVDRLAIEHSADGLSGLVRAAGEVGLPRGGDRAPGRASRRGAAPRQA
jgi:hypothetical protein